MSLLFPGVALVTGAGSGIGRETAKLFAKQGCIRIVIADINDIGAEETRKQIMSIASGIDALTIHLDVTSEESVNAMISETVKKFGRIDYACNVAGICIPGYSTEFSAAAWDTLFSVNARGMWLCQKAEIAQMLKQEPLPSPAPGFSARGAIANVSSMAGLRGYDNFPSYSATKHAIIGFTKSDGLRHGPDLIRVNAVCPGVIKTPMLGEASDEYDAAIATMTKDMAMGRQGLPEEVAECLVWIVSSRASFVTATTLAVNGGMIGA